MKNLKNFDFYSIAIFAGLFLIAIGLLGLSVWIDSSGFQLPFTDIGNHFVLSFSHEFGNALLIAALVILTIERQAKMRQEAEIADMIKTATDRKVLQDLCGSELRYQGLISVIKDNSCQKTNMNLDLNCQLLPEGTVFRKKSLSYQLHHSLDRSVDYSVTSYDKYSEGNKEQTFVDQMRIGTLENWIRRDDYSPPESATKEDIHRAISHALSNGHTLKLNRSHLNYFVTYNEFGEMNLDLPLQVPPCKKFKCLIQSVGVTSLPGTYEFLNSAVSDSISISVTYPQDLALKVKALHPQKEMLEEVFLDESSDGFTIKQRWYLPFAILPYWGVSLKFSKKDELL